MKTRRARLCACAVSCALATPSAFAGVTNPDISLIGQLRSGWTDDPGSQDKNRPTIGLGETELAADAALNPYASGAFVLSFADGEAEVEEAYIKLDQALPAGLAIKAGKYRAPFGKLNAAHPHAYPFLDAPHMMSILPGQESYDEAAIEVSELFPGIASWAPLLTLDVQQGSGFRTGQDTAPDAANYDSRMGQSHLSWLLHLGNSFQVGDLVVGDAGASYARGTTNVDSSQEAWLAGVDLKLKFNLATESRLTWQSEAIFRHDDAGSARRLGLYSFLDWTLGRWNVGTLYEQSNDASDGTVTDRAAKLFGGFSLMEETTLFRLGLERRWLPGQDPYHTVSAQILFSMGPHKPHQF